MSSKKNELPTIEIPEFKPEEMPLSCTMIIIGAPGSGKCFGKDTGIMMFDGSVKFVQDVVAGDLLMGDDSTPRKVLSTTTGRDKLYKISKIRDSKEEVDEGYVVNSFHVLSLLDHDGNIVDISVTDYLNLPETKSKHLRGYRRKIQDGQCNVMSEENRWGLLKKKLENHSVKIPGGVSCMSFDYEIADAMLVLARSLGITVVPKIFSFENRQVYEMQLRSFGDFREETANREDCKTGYTFTVEPLPEGDYYGFEVDGNHRFLLADFTVTHNSSFMENLAYYRKHMYPTARVFIGTEEGYKHFCKIFHPLYVSNYWDEKEEERHCLRQRTCEMENGRGYQGNYAINIIDDVGDDPKVYKTKLMRGIFKLGSQHWAQLAMIGSQYAIDFSPDVRKSVSYVALAREPEENERKKLYDNFGGLAGSYAKFCDLMDQITGDYTFLIFKKRSQSNNLEDCISWFRTKKLGSWKFGCKEYRKHAEERYDPNYVETITM